MVERSIRMWLIQIILILSSSFALSSQSRILLDLSLQRSNIANPINFAGRNPKPNINFPVSVNLERSISHDLKYSFGIGLMGISYNTENPDRNYVIRYLELPLGLKLYRKRLIFGLNISPSIHIYNWVSFSNESGFSQPSSGEMKSLVFPLSIYMGTKIGQNELLFGYFKNFENILNDTNTNSMFNGLRLTFRLKIKEYK